MAPTYFLSTAQFLPNRASNSAALRVGVNYPSNVTLSASSPTIVQGAGTTMNGTVIANNKVWPGAPVELWGGPSPVSGVTGLDGKVAFSVHPSAPTTYLLVALTKLPNPTSTSNQVTVTVPPPPPAQVRVTTLTASPPDVNKGAQTRLDGHVTVEGVPWAGASVTLTAVGMLPRTGTTDASGDVSCLVTPSGRPTFRIPRRASGHLHGGVGGLTMDGADGGAGTHVIFGLLPHLLTPPLPGTRAW